jgi:hypothetical protein
MPEPAALVKPAELRDDGAADDTGMDGFTER